MGLISEVGSAPAVILSWSLREMCCCTWAGHSEPFGLSFCPWAVSDRGVSIGRYFSNDSMLPKIFVLSQHSKGQEKPSFSSPAEQSLQTAILDEVWSESRTLGGGKVSLHLYWVWHERKYPIPLIRIRAMLPKGLPGGPWVDWSATVVVSCCCQHDWIVTHIGGVTLGISRDHEDSSKVNSLIRPWSHNMMGLLGDVKCKK